MCVCAPVCRHQNLPHEHMVQLKHDLKVQATFTTSTRAHVSGGAKREREEMAEVARVPHIPTARCGVVGMAERREKGGSTPQQQ